MTSWGILFFYIHLVMDTVTLPPSLFPLKKLSDIPLSISLNNSDSIFDFSYIGYNSMYTRLSKLYLMAPSTLVASDVVSPQQTCVSRIACKWLRPNMPLV